MQLVVDIEVGSVSETLLPRPASDGLALIQMGLAKLLHADVGTGDVHEALELISEVELVGRQFDAATNQVMDAIDRTGVHSVDGHRTARAMVANTGKLSGAASGARRKTMLSLRALPIVRGLFESGDISTCMVNRLGRTYANPRVRDLMIDADAWFAEHARNDTYEFFDTVVTEWERLADEDGAESRDARHDRARNHTMTQDEHGQWEWKGSAAAYDGAISKDIFDAFEQIEFDIDWRWAKDNYGDDANSVHMPRTAAQRRADAFAKVHEYAARALNAETGHEVTTDVVIDDETFERETRKIGHERVDADDPTRDDYVCATASGYRLHAKTAVARALLGFLRRDVIGANGVTIDLGRRRLFTGYARLAAQLSASECYWPGCHVNVKQCQVDHLTPFTPTKDRGGGGLTNPHNAGVACGKHNRHKERGYTVRRLPDGAIQIRRPDGSILN